MAGISPYGNGEEEGFLDRLRLVGMMGPPLVEL